MYFDSSFNSPTYITSRVYFKFVLDNDIGIEEGNKLLGVPMWYITSPREKGFV